MFTDYLWMLFCAAMTELSSYDGDVWSTKLKRLLVWALMALDKMPLLWGESLNKERSYLQTFGGEARPEQQFPAR